MFRISVVQALRILMGLGFDVLNVQYILTVYTLSIYDFMLKFAYRKIYRCNQINIFNKLDHKFAYQIHWIISENIGAVRSF